jgi:hypothetical protein
VKRVVIDLLRNSLVRVKTRCMMKRLIKYLRVMREVVFLRNSARVLLCHHKLVMKILQERVFSLLVASM